MHIESISRDKRRRYTDAFDPNALILLSGALRKLLLEWLKSSAHTRRWETLLTTAGPARIELAEALIQSLIDCGAAILEERFERSNWLPTTLVWRDYETLCAALGLTTPNVQRAAFDNAWAAAQHKDWQCEALAGAYQTLHAAPADKGPLRLALLIKLNDWLSEGKSGTRREFALFARGYTKQLSATEWAWLAGIIELEACGIERHAPALWIAGDVQLKITERWLDIGAAGDFIALTPATLNQLTAAKTSANHYRLIENRTSFEHVARTPASTAITLWLPGYAPRWWRAAVMQLLGVITLPARISCDADPDGVQIALNAAQLWTTHKLEWKPDSMRAEDAASAQHQLPLSARDEQLAQRLLKTPDLPTTLATLLRWCIDNKSKAEQENWL